MGGFLKAKFSPMVEKYELKTLAISLGSSIFRLLSLILVIFDFFFDIFIACLITFKCFSYHVYIALIESRNNSFFSARKTLVNVFL